MGMARDRVHQLQRDRVERMAVEGSHGIPHGSVRETALALRPPVEGILQERMADVCEVGPNLMRPPRQQFDLHLRDARTMSPHHEATVGSSNPLLGGERCRDARREALPILVVAAMSGEAFEGRLPRASKTERDISFVDAALLKRKREFMVGGVALGDDHDPAGVLVETMDDAGPQHTTDADLWHPRAQGVGEGVVGIPSSRMDDQTRWLVEYEDVFILKEHIER